MYEQTYRRLEKLKSTFDQLVIDNKSLREKLHKRDEPYRAEREVLQTEVGALKRIIETTDARDQARERVLKTLSEKIKEDREGVPPPT